MEIYPFDDMLITKIQIWKEFKFPKIENLDT